MKHKKAKPAKGSYDVDLAWLQATGIKRWVASDSPTAEYCYKPLTKPYELWEYINRDKRKEVMAKRSQERWDRIRHKKPLQ